MDDDTDIDTIITTYSTAVTDAASEILWKERHRKWSWFIRDAFDLCDERRRWHKAEGAKDYRKANKRIQKAVATAYEVWIGNKYEEIKTCLSKNNSKRAYQLVNDLTSKKQRRLKTVQSRSGKSLTERQEILIG
ncbi:MAG: hypothetical protein AB2693_32055 [Candidatus Thiodiazotropha sp.]